MKLQSCFTTILAVLVFIGCNKQPSTPPTDKPAVESPKQLAPAAPTEPEKPPVAEPSAVETHVDQAMLAKFPTSRPADATAFGGHWYKAFEEDICWHTAKAACEKMGGYLVCIETEKEQEFIAQLADGRYLRLGATDEKEEDTWVWVNGAKWEYTAWMAGQPNNYGDDEHYLATYDEGEWVDVADEGSGFWMPTGFICEWEK